MYCTHPLSSDNKNHFLIYLVLWKMLNLLDISYIFPFFQALLSFSLSVSLNNYQQLRVL
ncbi:DUF2770 family protein [Sulfurimonas sp. RIFOXYB12_FULL_35_9]|uniref:DUF2770 family protein n=1 Tax=Sulfurimonas sp. RIFOXYB12_FULL_35_9 TaxID=1802256 RepID=UPI0034543A79